MSICINVFVAVLMAAVGWPAVSGAATLQVPADYPTIQACINAAVSGVDECVVAPGTYHEKINFLGKAITVRSSGGAEVTTIDQRSSGIPIVGCGFYSWHSGSVVTCTCGEGPDTVLDGFTITGGRGSYVDSSGDPTIGGGMLIQNSSPTITNCIVSGNNATEGGGMDNYQSSPTVTNCTFSRNTAAEGGGMLNLYSSPTVTNCTFSGNTGSWGYGGGMENIGGSPTVTNCVFSGNTADPYFDGGGAGMYNSGGNPTVANCTFSGNTANRGGGMYNDYQSSPTVTNCILRGDAPEEVLNTHGSAPNIRFSNLHGGLPVGAIDGGGNIDLDPMFIRLPNPGPDGTWDGVDDDYGELRLHAGSPCIDAGDPGFVAQAGETDLDGHAQVLCGQVDMGAYEFGIGDYDCDQSVDLSDFSVWSSCMTGPHNGPYDGGCEGFDFDADGNVDLNDFASFQSTFKS